MMCEPVSGSAQVHITAIAVPYAVCCLALPLVDVCGVLADEEGRRSSLRLRLQADTRFWVVGLRCYEMPGAMCKTA